MKLQDVATYTVLAAVAGASILLPDSLGFAQASASNDVCFELTGVIWDFRESHPDFNNTPRAGHGRYTGIVASQLGADGAPQPLDLATNPGHRVRAEWRDDQARAIAPHLFQPERGDTPGVVDGVGTGGVATPETFAEWFRDIEGVNRSMPHAIELTRRGYLYECVDPQFLPIDGQLLGDELDGHNYFFTAAYVATFTYRANTGQFIEFAGGDGAWVFVGDQLVIDLGGTAARERQHADLDRLELVDGATYEMRLFYAQRRAGAPLFELRTSVELR